MRASKVYTAEGIVLKRRAIGEADRIVTLLTKQYGKIRLAAKGIRRVTSRRAGHLEIFNHVIVSVHNGHTVDILTEVQSVSRGSVFSRDIMKMGYAYCLCELVDHLMPERQEQRNIFFLLRDSLCWLKESTDSEAYQRVLTHFVHQLLWMLGYLPRERQLTRDRMKPYIEHITERRLRAWPLLTRLITPS